jgi:hypothetical protein
VSSFCTVELGAICSKSYKVETASGAAYDDPVKVTFYEGDTGLPLFKWWRGQKRMPTCYAMKPTVAALFRQARLANPAELDSPTAPTG